MITRLLTWWRNRADDGLKDHKLGHTYRFTGHDQDKASAARLRALDRAKAARKLADRYGRRADVVNNREGRR
jgi:hypothetical protein